MTPPNRYRAIQPAPTKRERSGASSGSSAHSGPPWLSGERQTRRLKAVTQACHACRRNKMRVGTGEHDSAGPVTVTVTVFRHYADWFLAAF